MMARLQVAARSRFFRLISASAILILAATSERENHRLAHAAATETAAPSRGGGGQVARHSSSRQNYFGSLVGKLVNRGPHGVSGDVYAVDEQTIFIRNLNYDGLAPDAYFWSSLTTPGNGQPSDGFIVPDEKGSTKPLERYSNKDVVLRLPEGKTLREIRWLAIWSRQLRSSVGDIQLTGSGAGQFIVPRPLEIGPLSQLAHGLRSGPITIVDAQTFLVPDFHYDGLGPDAYFWLTRGTSGLSSLNSLKLKDENGGTQPLRKYQGETVVISLPDEFTIYDFDFFGVWCRQFSANFGQVSVPQAARVPPSPKMLGIKPENKLNCEILYDDLGFEIRWVLDGDDIVMQLVGKIEPGEYMAFGLGKDDSKSDMNNADAVVAWVERQTGQVHAVDYFLGAKQQCKPVGDGQAQTFSGSCPDVKMRGGSDSLTLLHGAIVNGYSMVTFKRPQLGVDEQLDQHVYSDGQQSVIWAIGTLNNEQEVGYHRLRTKTNMFIDFARNPQWNCPIPDLNASMHNTPGQSAASSAPPTSHNSLPITSASQLDQTVVSASLQQQDLPAMAPSSGGGGEMPGGVNLATEDTPTSISDQQAGSTSQVSARQQGGRNSNEQQQQAAWFIPQIICPNDRTFYAQIGPTAGRKGYAGLTSGRGVGGGGGGANDWPQVPPVSWYINGLMIPELVLERNQVYKFVVEGGNDKLSSSRRHPLYLTDALDGGFNFKTDEERQRERIYAGVAQRASDGQFVPTAEGRLCEWKRTNATLADPDQYGTFSAYQRSLRLDCLPGQAAVLKFAPDAQTPDTLYYQCYTNRLMGWRIRVVNSCSAYLDSLQQPAAAVAQLQPAASQIVASRLIASTSNKSRVNGKGGGVSSWTSSKINIPKSITNARRRVDRAERRQSSTGDFDLRAQQSEQRMLSFEFAPQNLNQQQRQLEGTNAGGAPLPGEMDDFLSANSPAGALDFGDELAASEEQQQRDVASGQVNWHYNNSSQPIMSGNVSLLEQALMKQSNLISANELETFLDDSQPVDLMGALALAAGAQMNNPIQSPAALPLQQAPQRNATDAKGKQPGRLASINRMPKSLHAYMRRLASLYYPVQQQLASFLTPSATGTAQAAAAQNTQSAQQQAAAMAQLHQQIVAASSAIPNSISASHNNAAVSNKAPPQEPIAAGSAPSSTFSTLANLVPKPKIDLSKSNLSKKFNRFRIKSGRKLEPTAAAAAAAQKQQQQFQQARPPTPENEFNYDIFNNQLVQLAEQQKQLQSLESFAAAATAMVANQPDWGSGGHTTGSGQLHDNFASGATNPYYSGRGGGGGSSQQTAATPMSQAQLEQQDAMLFSPSSSLFEHQNDPLQQQQSSLDGKQLVMAAAAAAAAAQQQQFQQNQQSSFQQQNQNLLFQSQAPQQQQQQAVFITRLTVQPQQQQQFQTFEGVPVRHEPEVRQNQASNQQGNSAQPWRPPQAELVQFHFGQSQQSSRPQPSYLDSTDYSATVARQPLSIGESSSSSSSSSLQLQSSHGDELQRRPPASSSSDGRHELLSGIESGLKSQSEMPPGSHSNGHQDLDLDHMLAIERYSKQSSERRPPSIVHPITGEQVIGSSDPHELQEQQHSITQQHFRAPIYRAERLHTSTTTPSSISGAFPPQTTTTVASTTSASIAQPKRFASMLIDKHAVVAPTGSATTSGELLDSEQSAQDLKRLNASSEQAIFIARQPAAVAAAQEVDALQQAAVGATTEPASQAVLARPPSGGGPPILMDFFASESAASATTPLSNLGSITQSIDSSSSSPSAGPLVPSFGPPTQSWLPTGIANTNGGGEPLSATPSEQLIFKSNLIEPIRSTLVATNTANDFVRPNNLDSSPFTPLEMFSGGASYNQFRLRPPPLIESMLSQYQAPARPEPPVRVASYLAQHLASRQQATTTSGGGSGGQTSQMAPAPQSPSSNSVNNNGGNQTASQRPAASHLILLKPSPLPSHQPHTYALKAEFLPGAGQQLQSQNQVDLPGGELMYAAGSADQLLAANNRRLAGHQFDRLSSLSSPPSTSMILGTSISLPTAATGSGQSNSPSQQPQAVGDPMLAANSMQTLNFFLTDHVAPSYRAAPSSQQSTSLDHQSRRDQQHEPAATNSKLPSDNKTALSSNNATQSVKTQPAAAASQQQQPLVDGAAETRGDESSSSQNNNTVDNAILSHVMSLISANAIPAPPPALMPISNYASSTSDYFLPISHVDPAHHHHHQYGPHSILRARSLRT